MDARTKPHLLQEFFKAAGTIVNPEVKSWMDKGGQVVGYFCSAMPEEIITAAGLLPFRIRGTGSIGTDLADACLSSLNCTFSRHCLNLALDGAYDFLSGLIMFNTCDAVRRTYDHWVRRVNTPFLKLLHLPKKAETPQVDFVRQDLAGLIVIDSLCFGSRMLWQDIDESADDPISALARYYVAERPSCPRMVTEYEGRSHYVLDMVRDFHVDGVILERLTFCDPWGYEGYLFHGDLKDHKIPFLMLEREYNERGMGQLKTRVQAFLETMGR